MRSRLKKYGIIAAKVLAALFAAVILFIALVIILGYWPSNSDFQQTPGGREIYVSTNGVHTDIIFPMSDWEAWLEPEQFPCGHLKYEWVAVGWGHREFYLDTPTWAELKVSTALRAATGVGETILHITVSNRPTENERCRRLTISQEQYRQLLSDVKESFELGTAQKPEPLEGAHYHQNDAFYEAHGTYTALNTCNSWTGRKLRNAGLKTGAWTPLSWAVMHHLPGTNQ